MNICRLNIARRILLVLAIGFATPVFVSIEMLYELRSSLLEARASEVRHLVESAWTTVALIHEKAVKGLMTEDVAKEIAKNAVRAMRYDGTNYFFIWDLSGVGVAHGGNAALEGRNFISGPDAIAKPGVADMVGKLVAVAKDHREGFAWYKIPKAGQTVSLDKIGYSKLFEPWGWAIGTGAYVADIDSLFWSKAFTDVFVTVCLTGVAFALSWMLGRNLSRALRGLADAMKKLAAGDLSAPIPSLKRGDEVGVMAGAVQVFRDGAVRALDRETSEMEAAALVVSSIGEGLERLAAGDLTFGLNTPLPAAYEKLRTDFNSAMRQLNTLVHGVVESASGIRAGTGQIADAADDLSHRTEHQAARLEETAAALDEITTTVKRAAESTLQAGAIVAATASDAEDTGVVVRDAVSAMEEIEKSSQQISRVVGLIDDIAAQTNLLALNAGIEAARAGDAGRGFAVVAIEVRALAKRSAEAAKEIKALIGASTRQVSSGVKLVGETGAALERILDHVGSVRDMVAKIASAAQEQATGLHQVNESLNQMDGVTQQNAVMVEESTAASRHLMREAEKLARLTGCFQVSEGPNLLDPGNAADSRRLVDTRKPPPLTSTGRDEGQALAAGTWEPSPAITQRERDRRSWSDKRARTSV